VTVPREPPTFTDASGCTWTLYDFRLEPVTGTKKKVPLGRHDAEGRAFVSGERIMIYWFGLVAYRDTSPKNLAAQLALAKPVAATAGDRMQRNG
jgi:hypothetical protein